MMITDTDILTAIKTLTNTATGEARMVHLQDHFGADFVRVNSNGYRRSTLRFQPRVTERRIVRVAEAHGYKSSPGATVLYIAA